MSRAAIAAALCFGLGLPLLGAGCGPKTPPRPEPQCTAENKQVECWWVLYGCMPELAPRDACMSICRDQEKGQLKLCEGKLPHRADPVMMSVRHMGCDGCLRFSDKPLGK
ncbi:MAG TPA: hypothetical protein VGQ83_27855 [Polyangia bacterium]|jgi:hypothetical protein